MCFRTVATVVAFTSSQVLAQQVWFERQPIVTPPARWASPLAYDPVRQVAVMFGGYTGSGNLADTWEYDGFSWTQRVTPVQPSARHAHALEWDPVSQRVVLFGGGGATLLNDTWLWDGTSWTQHNPSAPAPSPRTSPCIGSTPALPGVLLLGGQSNPSSVFFGDFWHWDGVGWLQLATTTPIGTRAQGAMAYDPAFGLVLAGGVNTTPIGTFYNDTWVFNGTGWSHLAVTPYGAPRSSCAVAFAADRGRIVLFGGTDLTQRFADTHELGPSGWQLVPASTGPGVRVASAALTANTGSVLLFGGGDGFTVAYSDTWVYGEATPPTVTSVGVGCTWGAGTPAFSAPRLPWRGELFELHLTNLSPTGLPFLAFGAQAPAPLDLTPLGAPGCFFHLAPGFVLEPGVPISGACAWAITIPPAFVGTFAAQGAMLDAAANPLGIVVSNAMVCTAQ